MQATPLHSLQQGTWFKLICGASLNHLPSIRTLAYIYTLAGVDCIDMAADPSVVRSAKTGVALALQHDSGAIAPFLMASFNDGEDPHFRKAIPTSSCPPHCLRPCIASCPTVAITEPTTTAALPNQLQIQIQADRCFGCGRCEPVCPYDAITTQFHQVPAAETLPQLLDLGVQAIEIHTRIGREQGFSSLWQQLAPWRDHLEIVSISFNDGDGLGEYLSFLQTQTYSPNYCSIWQVDGRPMSGDIGVGATRATVQLAQKVLAMNLTGFVQLAGGTNQATMPKARDLGLPVAGAAFGSYARKLVAESCEMMADPQQWASLKEGDSSLLAGAISKAKTLVGSVKSSSSSLS